MKRTFLALFLLAQAAAPLLAQNQTFTIEQAVRGQWREFYPKTTLGYQWMGQTDQYTFLVDYMAIAKASANGGEPETLITLDEFNNLLAEAGQEGFGFFFDYQWLDAQRLLVRDDGRAVVLDLADFSIEAAVKAPEGAANAEFCVQNGKMAYTLDNDLYLVGADGKPQVVAQDDDPGIVFGQTVSRNEFGIGDGIFFSPKGGFLAFYRKDERQVSQYPLVDASARVAELAPTRYPMAGMASEHIALGVLDLATGKTLYLEDNPGSEQYLTNITWSPDEKHLYIAVLNREQNHMKLNQYEAATGRLVKTLFEEKHERYVEPEHGPIFLPGKPDQFLWQSERDGWNHLYLYKTDGSLVRQLSSGPWVVLEVLGFSPDASAAYLLSTEASPLEANLYELSLANGKTRRLTEEPGTHTIALNAAAGYFIDQYSSTDTPNRELIREIRNGKLKAELLVAENPLADFKMPQMEMIQIMAADGKTVLHGRLFKPTDFDPAKKYPVVVYVYGGPHAQLVTNSWLGGASLWQHYMAQRGYLVFTLDNRGSANRGFEFESVIHRQVGTNEMADQMRGIEYLRGLGYADMDRVGVHGWSYGGFMTTSLMAHHAETFKVGVAGGPVIDWQYYEVMYGERYMDSPQENPQGYAASSLVNAAAKVKGRLMLIHGDIDPVVVPQHSLAFLKACVDEDVLVDFLLYPGHEHNVGGIDRVHLMRVVTRYFDDHL